MGKAKPLESALLIPQLEPLAGSGLAVSLAYLALERFRYRDAVERYASELKVQYKSEGEDTVEVVKDLQWLCRQDCNGHTPRGAAASFYHYAFRNKADEVAIAAFALIAGMTLIAGVALNLKYFWWLPYLEHPSIISFLFFCCSCALLLPAISVLCGRRCVAWGRDFAHHCETEINKIHKQSALNAPIPDVPPANDTQVAAKA